MRMTISKNGFLVTAALNRFACLLLVTTALNTILAAVAEEMNFAFAIFANFASILKNARPVSRLYHPILYART